MKFFKTISLLSLIFFSLFCLVSIHTYAAENDSPGGTQTESDSPGGTGPVTSPQPTARPADHISIQNPLAANSITDFIHDIIKIILIIATPLIVLMIIVAGFMYVMAQGKPEKISQANKALLFALIGGLLILGAFVLEQVIQGTVDAFMS